MLFDLKKPKAAKKKANLEVMVPTGLQIGSYKRRHRYKRA
jgi:hypothetical protein